MPPEKDEPMEMKVIREDTVRNNERSEGSREGREGRPRMEFRVNASARGLNRSLPPSGSAKKPDGKK